MRTAVPDPGFSPDLQGHSHGIRWQATTEISLTTLEEKLKGDLQIRSCFLNGFSLAIRAWNLQADRSEATLLCRLHHGSQFTTHQTRPGTTFQSLEVQKKWQQPWRSPGVLS